MVLGIITEVLEEADALDSSYTIEDPDDPDDDVVVTGAQLAGLEGFRQARRADRVRGIRR